MAAFWKKTLVYLGLAEDEEYDDYAYEDLEEPEAHPQRRAPVRRLSEAGAARGGRDAVVRPMPSGARFHLVQPTDFNDAQEVGDKYREGYSVLMNLQAADKPLQQRLVDFVAGLAYSVKGSIQRVGDHVYLVTPPGVQVSAEERRRFLEERGFFNQA